MRQQALQLVHVDYAGSPVDFQIDGYLNATQIAKRFGKQTKDFLKADRTKTRINLIRRKLLIEGNQVVIVRPGSPDTGGGTWLHPKLAIPFADWLDPEFGFWCDEQIEKIIRGELVELPTWRRNIQDRLDYNPIPLGLPYFSVFRELLDVTHALASSGLAVDPSTLIDISVGRRWSTKWENELKFLYSESRYKMPHEFPPTYPQSRANGLIEAYVYPVSALSAFRQWLADEYLPTHFSQYLKGKAQKGHLPKAVAVKLIEAVNDARYKLAG